MIKLRKETEMSKERTSYSALFKLETVLEGIWGEKSIAQLCRERGIEDTLSYIWREELAHYQFQAK
jgi:transposase-like protein